MKKKLSLLAQATLTSSAGLSVACNWNPLSGGKGDEGKKPEPPVKDVAYYQQLIEQQESDVADCDEMLQEIKDNRDGYDDEEDYQSALDEVTAEKHYLKSLINEYQYQILLLEKKGSEFTADQVLEGIAIFTEKISNLQEELKLKEKYPDYYSEVELNAIRNKIVEAKEILKMFQDLKEEE